MCTIVASLNKIIFLENTPTSVESGISLCPPNYTKNRNVRNLLDTPDLKDKMPTKPEAIKGKNLVNKYREVRIIRNNGKRVRHQDLPLWNIMRGTGSYRMTKKVWYKCLLPRSPFPKVSILSGFEESPRLVKQFFSLSLVK